jgi:hypothetical protein
MGSWSPAVEPLLPSLDGRPASHGSANDRPAGEHRTLELRTIYRKYPEKVPRVGWQNARAYQGAVQRHVGNG